MKRLGQTPPPAAIKPHQFVAVRTKGLQLVATLQPAALDHIVRIDTAEGFLEMDAKLAAIRHARAQWTLALEPISGPLSRAIQKQKEALAEAKKAAEGAKQLEDEVSARLDSMERKVKGLMADYKQHEQRKIEAERQERERQSQKFRDEAARRALQASSARTPQLKARLEQQRAELEAQAEEVAETVAEVAPIKGASSITRTQQKVRIDDPMAFLRAVKPYEPTAGVYEMGHPPLMVTDKRGEPAALVDIVSARLNELFREQPGVVASWPGVTIFDDVTIANR